MGFCGEMVMRRTPEKGTGGSGEGGATRGQGNFERAANSGYYSRGSADPRESLCKRRISKLPLTAHKVLPERSIRDLALFVCKGEGVKVAGGRLWLIAQNTNK